MTSGNGDDDSSIGGPASCQSLHLSTFSLAPEPAQYSLTTLSCSCSPDTDQENSKESSAKKTLAVGGLMGIDIPVILRCRKRFPSGSIGRRNRYGGKESPCLTPRVGKSFVCGHPSITSEHAGLEYKIFIHRRGPNPWRYSTFNR